MSTQPLIRVNEVVNIATGETSPVLVGVASIVVVRPGYGDGARIECRSTSYHNTTTIHVTESIDDIATLAAMEVR